MSIRVSKLSKSYSKQKAVDAIDFSVEKGEIVGFLGPNGAGKSTVMKILTGFIKDFEGAAIINDLAVDKYPVETKKSIGYLPEHNPLYEDMYVREYLAFNAQIYKVPKTEIESIITEVGLTSHASKKIQELSKGYRQRVGLAAALLHNPEVLILDEPTTGLDPNQLVEIRALIKNVGKDKTVLFSTHIMQEVEAICDRVIIIHEGKIVSDQILSEVQDPKKQLIEVEFDSVVDIKLLETLSHIEKVEKKKNNTWDLTFNSEKDMRATVFDLARENNLKILSLSRKNKNLEKMFSELTEY